MRILYGVVGEGMGHAIRSRVVLEHLAPRHELHVVVSGRAHRYLSEHLEAARHGGSTTVHRIWGLSIVHEDSAVLPVATALENLKGALAGLPRNVVKFFELVSDFDPDVVISDYESWSYLFGRVRMLPVISLDNIQAVARCQHPPEILRGHEALYRMARTFTGSKLPHCAHYLITSFFPAELRKEHTTLVPPILREEILAARERRRSGGHLLVYQTASGDERLSQLLRAAGVECRIYGLRAVEEEVVEGKLRFRPFSDSGFIEDLVTCQGVVAGGGFTLLGEAVYLGKPVLSLPIAGQFEQLMNARWIEHLGYGRCAEEPERGVLEAFLARLPEHAARLEGYTQKGNQRTFEALGEQLHRVESGELRAVGL